MPRKLIDIQYQKFGKLTVLKRSETNNKKWLCKCECGVEKEFYSNNLRSGDSKSCGCEKRRKLTNRNTKHGQAVKGKVSNEYYIWETMKQRCYNTKSNDYCRYGKRGITVCDEWLNSFEQFYLDMGPQPFKGASIDRIDNKGNYELSNCRWASYTIQARNTRKTKLNVELVKEIKQMIKQGYSNREISEDKQINRTTIYNVRVGNTWKDITID